MIKFTKLDASKRQLETAIKIYFLSNEPVSVHTLTAAAYNVLRALCKGNYKTIIKDLSVEMLKDEYQPEFRSNINKAENFFKHADRDPDNTLDFNPKLSEMMLFEAVGMYEKITAESPATYQVYKTWFHLHNPNIFQAHVKSQILVNLDDPDISVLIGNKIKFYFDLLRAAELLMNN